MVSDFKAFLKRGNVVELATAVVVGGAFGVVAKSLVDDLLMPPIGLLLGRVDPTNLFTVIKNGPKVAPPYASLAEAKAAGAVTINYGLFLNNVITFLIVALAIFLVIRGLKKMRREPAADPTTKACPFCATDIPKTAVRCPHCTSDLAGKAI